jgi:hypothetical protein
VGNGGVIVIRGDVALDSVPLLLEVRVEAVISKRGWLVVVTRE